VNINKNSGKSKKKSAATAER